MEQIVADTQYLKFAEDAIGIKFGNDAKAIARIVDGQTRAVCVYEGFCDVDCRIHIATDGSFMPINRKFLKHCFWYPFVQLKLNRITGLVPATNKRALKFDLSLGFVSEGLIRKGLPGDDLVILGMLREECRFIPNIHRGLQHG